MRSAPLGYIALALAAASLYVLSESAAMSILISSAGILAVTLFLITSWQHSRALRASANSGTMQADAHAQSAAAPTQQAQPSGPQAVSQSSSAPRSPSAPPPPPPQQPNAADSDPLIGGRYRKLRILGAGGMKRVYLVEDVRLKGRQCALAELLDAATDPAQQIVNQRAFEHEADLLAELKNEHIVEIYDRFSEGGSHFLVMEFVDGVTLEAMAVGAGGHLSEASAVEIAIQILEALSYLHGRNPPIIFRDMKPENVMVANDGRIKLVDFGIARNFTTAKATKIGTPGYAAPEQWSGTVDPRADIYALGAVLHRLLSGQVPERLQKFAPIASLCPGIDARLAALIDASVSVRIEKRPQSAALLLAELRNLRVTRAAPQARSSANGKPKVRFCAKCGTALSARGKCSACGAARYA